MWRPITEYVILRHGARAFDCRDCLPNASKTTLLTINEHNKVLLSIRLVLRMMQHWRYVGCAFYPVQTPYYEYQMFLWDLVDNRPRQYRGYKSYNYFHFDVGENRGVSVNLKLAGYLKRPKKHSQFRLETDIIICEPQGQPTYSVVTLYNP